MNEQEYFNEMISSPTKEDMFVDGAEHFIRLKQQTGYSPDLSLEKDAGLPSYSLKVQEKTASIKDAIKNIDPIVGTAVGLGALVGGIGMYQASKPREELGGKSKGEVDLEDIIVGQQNRPETGLMQKMKNRTTELGHGYAKAFRDHPVKASLMAGATGALGGLRLAKHMGAMATKGKK